MGKSSFICWILLIHKHDWFAAGSYVLSTPEKMSYQLGSIYKSGCKQNRYEGLKWLLKCIYFLPKKTTCVLLSLQPPNVHLIPPPLSLLIQQCAWEPPLSWVFLLNGLDTSAGIHRVGLESEYACMHQCPHRFAIGATGQGGGAGNAEEDSRRRSGLLWAKQLHKQVNMTCLLVVLKNEYLISL